jgi:nucleoid DNA-binding protein
MRQEPPMVGQAGKEMSEADVYAALAEATDLSVEEIERVFAALNKIARRELRKKTAGTRFTQFTLIGLLRFRVVRLPAKPARMEKNPRTGKPIRIPGKPAGVFLSCRPLKKLKDLLTAAYFKRKP